MLTSRSPSMIYLARSATLRRLTLGLVPAFVLLACGTAAPGRDGSTDADAMAPVDAPPDAAPVVDVAPDLPFVTAPHNPLPQVTNLGGSSISHVRLVVITYADDQSRAGIESFGSWVGGSDWIATTGADYGVGAGTVLDHGIVELTDNAPDAITSTEIETFIGTSVLNHTLPSPADGDYSNVLYMLFFPSHTTVTLMAGGAPSTSCQGFDGYHGEVHNGALHLVYATVEDCPSGRATDLGPEEQTASHEYFEAATDPYPNSHAAYRLPTDGSTAWGLIGGELGDLCELTHAGYTDGAFTVQRMWSNTAAAAGGDPCIPASTTSPYFNVSVDPGDVQYASGGDTVTFALTGWSQVAVPTWELTVYQSAGNVPLTPHLHRTTLNNGITTTLTFQVPVSASQGYASFIIESMEPTSRARQDWPVAIIVQ